MRAFHREQLAGIERDLAQGRMTPDQAEAAKAELAREVLRAEKETRATARSPVAKPVVLASIPLIIVISMGLYAYIGRADLPAQPLAGREVSDPMADIDLEQAIGLVEARLEENPNDVRGWLVLAPIYLQRGRYSEAANAWRRIISLDGPTPDRETNLAEALILANDGEVTEEALDLLESAVSDDPMHVRSRFYLAGELTRIGAYERAVPLWQELLALGTGEEPWIPTARAGLNAAEAGLTGASLADPVEDQTANVMIRGMVESLAARLRAEGGSVSEWEQLVRSRLVLDGEDAAQEDLGRGLAELSGEERRALVEIGQELGLDAAE